MPVGKSWIPTTNTVVLVTDVSQVVLPANEDAVLRVLIPLTSEVLWLAFNEAAVVRGTSLPILLRLGGWRERAAGLLDRMFRGEFQAVHNFGPGTTVPLLVFEAEEE